MPHANGDKLTKDEIIAGALECWLDGVCSSDEIYSWHMSELKTAYDTLMELNPAAEIASDLRSEMEEGFPNAMEG